MKQNIQILTPAGKFSVKSKHSILKHTIVKVETGLTYTTADIIAVEEPLEIRVAYGENPNRTLKTISVTMRTPGNDEELAAGFLFTEGIIKHQNELLVISHSVFACAENKENIIQLELNETSAPNLKNIDRNFYTTSSCGVCGKGSIEAIKTVSQFAASNQNDIFISADILLKLPDLLRAQQAVFDATGGLHACALFTPDGELILVREDVGRHNALDKLIGATLIAGMLPLRQHILLLSGRASFELVQKAAMAGISIIAAVGAPSSLAVQLAEEFGITLAGFLRHERFNIYTQQQRILLPEYENKN